MNQRQIRKALVIMSNQDEDIPSDYFFRTVNRLIEMMDGDPFDEEEFRQKEG